MKEFKIQEKRLLRDLKKFEVYEILKKNNAVVAGGAVVSVFNNNEINDYDIYCKSQKDVENLLIDLKEKEFLLKVTSINAYSLCSKKQNKKQLKIQIIRNEDFCQKDVNKVFNYFDFYCCMGAYDFQKETFILNPRFLSDNLEKKIVFNPGTKFPICSLYRTLKYQKKGYKLSGLEMIKIALTINDLQIKTYGDLKKQLQGIDTLFLKPLTDKLMNRTENDYKFENFMEFFEDFNESDCGLTDDQITAYLGEQGEISNDDETILDETIGQDIEGWDDIYE